MMNEKLLEQIIEGERIENKITELSAKLAEFIEVKNLSDYQFKLVLEDPILKNIAHNVLASLGIKYTDINNEELVIDLKKSERVIVISESKFLNAIDNILWSWDALNGYILLDDYVAENHQKEKDFKDVWNLVAQHTTQAINDYGWSSSYTGEKLPLEEMNQFIENFMIKSKPYITKDSRVLEIGCGHGIVYSNIAPLVDYYLATDLSDVIIEKNRKLARLKGLDNIEFEAMPASSIDKVKEADFDLIICSSVINFFPETLYLEYVIRSAINLLKDEGIIYLDDMLSLEKKPEFIESLKRHKKRHPNDPVKVNREGDLFICKAFFELLQHKCPDIVECEITEKLGEIKNEVTKYRFDVILKVNKNRRNNDTGEKVLKKNRWTLMDIEHIK